MLKVPPLTLKQIGPIHFYIKMAYEYSSIVSTWRELWKTSIFLLLKI